MRNWGWGLLVLVALTTDVGAAEKQAAASKAVPVGENAGYTYCVREANDALTLGRFVMATKRTREQVESDAHIAPYIRSMAGSLFDEMAAGRAPTHVHFGMTRFKSCLVNQKVSFEVPDQQLFTCLSRVDIPFYFLALRQSGVSEKDAIAEMKKNLAAWGHPDAVIEILARPSYGVGSPADLASLQVFTVNTCLLPEDQAAAMYGAPPDAAPATAPAPGSKAGAQSRKAP
ncbi:MAG TPA: hypothetical protein VFM34_12655 [Moraxellaceae bacterium]|nr:hypothetical protein [Moraxellaceae bacterium]